jgi:DNA-binding MarR family transcriptional regulator
MNKTEATPLPFQVMGALGAIASRLEAALSPMGLSLAKFRVLSRLVSAGEPLALSTLAEHSSCVRSNITQLVDRLEADKLVVRVNDPHDRRLVLAAITGEGRARHEAAVEALARVERDLFPQSQRETLRRLLSVLQPES